MNGVLYFDNYGEWETTLEVLHNRQVDIVCLTEINLDVTKPDVTYELREELNKLDRNSSIVMTASKTLVYARVSKRGGAMALGRGNWSGRGINKGKDKFG